MTAATTGVNGAVTAATTGVNGAVTAPTTGVTGARTGATAATTGVSGAVAPAATGARTGVTAADATDEGGFCGAAGLDWDGAAPPGGVAVPGGCALEPPAGGADCSSGISLTITHQASAELDSTSVTWYVHRPACASATRIVTGETPDEVCAYTAPAGSNTVSSNREPGQPRVNWRSLLPSPVAPAMTLLVSPVTNRLVSTLTGLPRDASAVSLKTVNES